MRWKAKARLIIGKFWRRQWRQCSSACDPVCFCPHCTPIIGSTFNYQFSPGDANFRSGFIGALFGNIVEEALHIGPTLMVILCALITEYLDVSPIALIELLRGISKRIESYAGSLLSCHIRPESYRIIGSFNQGRLSVGIDAHRGWV